MEGTHGAGDHVRVVDVPGTSPAALLDEP